MLNLSYQKALHRTLKEQGIEGQVFKNGEEVRDAVRQFVGIDKEKWLIARHDYQSPLEVRRNYRKMREAT